MHNTQDMCPPSHHPEAEDDQLRLLLVDDDPVVRQMMVSMVENWNHEPHAAPHAEGALELLEQMPFDVVVSDIRMPGMDGIELLRRISARWPETDVVMITAYGMSYSYMDVIEAGATDFVTKPFEPDELRAKLQRIGMERRLRRELLHLSTRDGLTGLLNRRTFHDSLAREVERAHRQDRPLALLVLDVDNFKQYNDRHGHLGGDAALQALAVVLEESLRQQVDTAFRIGGDEFAALLIEADADQALQIAERVRTAFEDRHLNGCTVSIGLAGLLAEETPADLLRRSDRSLYQAKHGGGNRIDISSGEQIEESPR
jgi:diguanylate cyclase (GGDEF)-like protein